MTDPSPETRAPVLSEQQVERIVSAMQRSGASVNVSDPRVSQVQTWILGMVGVGIIAACGWMAQSIGTLSTTVGAAVQRLDQYGDTLADHEQRLRAQERSK